MWPIIQHRLHDMKNLYIIVKLFVLSQNQIDLFSKLKTENYDICILTAEWEWNYFQPTDNPEFIWSKLINIIKQRGKKLYIINGSNKILIEQPNDPNITVFHWDTRWLTNVSTQIDLSKYSKIISKYTYHYICMNRRPHTWRCHLIDLIAKNDLLKYGAISWHDKDKFVYGIDRPLDDHNYFYDWKYFTPVVMKLTDFFAGSTNLYDLPDEYNQSFAQLISESNADSAIFLTEKTSIPLIVGKPFLTAAAPGFHKFLLELGFELYTEIFDYSFDQEPSREKRFNMLLENFVRLSKMPFDELPNLYSLIETKIKHNKQRVLDINKQNINKPEIVQQLNINYVNLNLNGYTFVET